MNVPSRDCFTSLPPKKLYLKASNDSKIDIMENSTKSKTWVDLAKEQQRTDTASEMASSSKSQSRKSSVDFRPQQNSTNTESTANEWEYISSSDLNPSSVNRLETKQADMLAAENSLLLMQLDDAEKIMKQKDKEIRTRDAQKALLRKALEEREKDLVHKKEQVMRQNTEIEKLEAQKDKEIAVLSRKLQDLNTKLAAQARKEEYVRGIEKDLRKMKGTVAGQKAKDEKIALLTSKLDAVSTTLSAQRNKDLRIAFLSREVNAATNTMLEEKGKKDHQIADLQNKLRQAQETVDHGEKIAGEAADQFHREIEASRVLEEKRISLVNVIHAMYKTHLDQDGKIASLSAELSCVKARLVAHARKDERNVELQRQKDLQIEGLQKKLVTTIAQGTQKIYEIAQLSAKLACAKGTIQTLQEQHLIDLDSLLEQKEEEIHALAAELDDAKESVLAQAEQIPALKEKLAAAEAEAEEQKKEGEKNVEESEGAKAELNAELEVEKKMAEKKIEYIEKLQTDIIVAKETIAEQGEKLKQMPGACKI